MPCWIEGGRGGMEHCLFVSCDNCEDAFCDDRGYGVASNELVEDVFYVGLERHGAVKFDVYFRLGRIRE